MLSRHIGGIERNQESGRMALSVQSASPGCSQGMAGRLHRKRTTQPRHPGDAVAPSHMTNRLAVDFRNADYARNDTGCGHLARLPSAIVRRIPRSLEPRALYPEPLPSHRQDLL